MFAQGKDYRLFLKKIMLIFILAANPGMLTARVPEKKNLIRVWDTSSFLDNVDVQDKTGWKIIHARTVSKYSFKGDIAVENDYITAVFSSKTGKLLVYSKPDSKKRIECIPLQFRGETAHITTSKILQNTDEKVSMEVHFSTEKLERDLSAVFSFGKNQIIEIKPAGKMEGICLFSPIEFAVVPDFIGGDLIFDPGEYTTVETLYIPAENLSLGLLKGKDAMLVITYPEGKQEIKLVRNNMKGEELIFDSVEFKNDGKSIYLTVLNTPDIWHIEELKSSYMEKDISIGWKRPFPAKWKTQLYEDEVKTTYRFRESKRKSFWRGGVGTYTYPVWFNGEEAFYHLGKKVPPKGESLVYFVEGSNNTPSAVSPPAEIMKQTIGNQMYEKILDFDGRKQISDTRPNSCVGTATCGVTGKLKPIFKAGKEGEKKDYIKGGTEDMVYHLTVLTERADGYQVFAGEMIEYLTRMKKKNPESRQFLNKVENLTKEIISAYNHQKENIKSIEYAEELAQKTVALTEKKSSDNLPAYLKLGREWRGMGGSLEGLVRELHTKARRLLQEAGFSSAKSHSTFMIAKEIRNKTRKLLRNPCGYEIW